MSGNGSEGHTGWREGLRRMALPATLAVIVATSGAQATPVAAAGAGIGQPDHVWGRKDECVNNAEDPCVYLVSVSPTQITIGLEPGFLTNNFGSSEEYHVRWSASGGPETPVTVGPATAFGTQTFTLTKTADDFAVFRFAVQRCVKVQIGKDTCSGWTVRSYGGLPKPPGSGIEITPNPNAAGNGIETKPNPRTKKDNGIDTRPNANARK